LKACQYEPSEINIYGPVIDKFVELPEPVTECIYPDVTEIAKLPELLPFFT
jgi:hypothetical protein